MYRRYLLLSNDDLLKLDNQLCFSIYACSRGLTRMYRPLLSALNITYPQYLVLLILWENDGLAIKQLGERLHLDSGTLTPLLKRLEAAGVVKRKRSKEDERRVCIFLTKKGFKLKEKAYEVPEKMLCQSGLSIDQFVNLKTELGNLLEQIQKLETVPRDH